MKLINRSSFTLLAKAPFANWVATLEGKISVDDGYELLSLAQLRESGSVYLIDEVAQEQDFDTLFTSSWQQMFENELSAWDEFGDYWPEINIELFRQWFDCQENLMSFDLCKDQMMSAKISG